MYTYTHPITEIIVLVSLLKNKQNMKQICFLSYLDFFTTV